jgi:hypothetical protein
MVSAECITDEGDTARQKDLEAGFQFVLENDAELLQRLEDAGPRT